MLYKTIDNYLMLFYDLPDPRQLPLQLLPLSSGLSALLLT